MWMARIKGILYIPVVMSKEKPYPLGTAKSIESSSIDNGYNRNIEPDCQSGSHFALALPLI